jgi:hypothetical protein
MLEMALAEPADDDRLPLKMLDLGSGLEMN